MKNEMKEKKSRAYLGLSPITLVIAAVLAVPLVYGGYRAYFNYSGYCFEQGRYLSDAEKIDLAARNVMGFYRARIDYEKAREKRDISQGRPGNEQPKVYIPYQDINEFFLLNPECCKVTKEFHDGDGFVAVEFWDRITGSVSDYVTVEYFVRYRDLQGLEHRELIKTHPIISNCGRVGAAY